MKPNALNVLIFNMITQYNQTDNEYTRQDLFDILLASMFHYNIWESFSYYAEPDMLISMKKAIYDSSTFKDMMAENKDNILGMGPLKIQHFYFEKIPGKQSTMSHWKEYVSGSGTIVYVEEVPYEQ